MANDNLKILYTQVFTELSPQIQGFERGLLYKTIQIILKEEESPTQEKTLEICNRLGITAYADESDDNEIISEVRQRFFPHLPLLDLLDPISNDQISNALAMTNELIDFSIKHINQIFNKEDKMKWIVITACILVGVSCCIQYLNKTKKKETNKSQPKKRSQISPPPRSIPVDLCLVVPASIAINFRNNQDLRVNEIKYLIDNASYLLCTEANSNEQKLELTNEDIATVSEQREVYIRIGIDNGREIIGEKVPYTLKGNLPSNGEGIVEELACLKYLSVSGLEKFNRI
jgi:hypothetical protein